MKKSTAKKPTRAHKARQKALRAAAREFNMMSCAFSSPLRLKSDEEHLILYAAICAYGTACPKEFQ